MPNNRLRKLIAYRTALLGDTEHQEIFKILQRHGIKFSTNRYHALFGLSSVSDAIIEEIRAFIDFCFDNKQELDEYDKRLHACKMSNNFDVLLGSRPAADGSSSTPNAPPPATTTVGTDDPAPSPVDDPVPPPADASVPDVEAQAVTEAEAEAGVTPLPPPPAPSSRERQIALERQLAASVVPPRGKAVTSKFQQAMKKYKRRRVCDRRQDCADAAFGQLQPEPYLVPSARAELAR
jgi:hypothetical protein